METCLRAVTETMEIEKFLSLEPNVQNNIVGISGMGWNNVYGDFHHDNGYWYAGNMNIGAKKNFNFIEDPAEILKRVDGINSTKITEDCHTYWECTILHPSGGPPFNCQHEKLGIAVSVALLMSKGFLL